MNHKPSPGIPEEISKSADRMLEQIQSGKIRKHLLGSSSRVQHSSIENIEHNSYCDFVKSKLYFDVIRLEGKEHHE